MCARLTGCSNAWCAAGVQIEEPFGILALEVREGTREEAGAEGGKYVLYTYAGPGVLAAAGDLFTAWMHRLANKRDHTQAGW
jgi:hypothetical protein